MASDEMTHACAGVRTDVMVLLLLVEVEVVVVVGGQRQVW